MFVLSLALLGCEPELPPGQCENADLIESWVDADLDGFGDAGTRELVCQLRDGLVTNKRDCDDQRSLVNPEALELCDGIDNDCDGRIDDGLRELDYYQDLDGDGFGSYENTIEACTPPPGYVENFDDCNDLNAQIHPMSREICNGNTDDNCNGRADDDDPTLDRTTATEWYYDLDDDGYGGTEPLPFPDDAIDQLGFANPYASCARPELPAPLASLPGTYVGNNDDCDDLDASVSPAGTETCNLIDDDCDNLIDDSDPDLDPAELNTFYADDDRDGAGDSSRPSEACFQPWFTAPNAEDCDDTNPLLQGPTGWWVDGDGDGFGTGDLSNPVCSAPGPNHVLPALGEDCDDDSVDDYPGAPEVCDGVDNDCDTYVDIADDDLDVFTAVPVWRDLDLDGYGDPRGEALACEGVGLPGYVDNPDDCDDLRDDVAPDATERCNGIDDDCDTLVDTEDLDVDLSTAPTWWADFDEDGWGNRDLPVVSCEQPNFYTDNDLDCDDGEELEGPEVEWWIDGDGDGVGAGVTVGPQCDAPAINAVPALGEEDCDDDLSSTYPGADDECGDGVDSDCNGEDGGVFGCLSDTCAEASAAPPVLGGTQRFSVGLVEYADDLGNPSCVPSTTANGDAFVPVRVASGQVVRASVDSTSNTYVALIQDCNVASTCTMASDALAAGSEEVVFENTGADLDAFVLVGCSDPLGCPAVEVEVTIASVSSWRADSCTGVGAAVTLESGAYTMSGVFEGLSNGVDIGSACTGMTTSAREALFPVDLLPGERIRAVITGETLGYGYYYTYGENDSLYLMEPCGGGAASCVAGVSGSGLTTLSYTNSTGTSQSLTMGAECGLGPYAYIYPYYYPNFDCIDLDMLVVIETP